MVEEGTAANGGYYVSIYSKKNYNREVIENGYTYTCDGKLGSITISKMSILDWNDYEGVKYLPIDYIGMSSLGVVYTTRPTDVRFDYTNTACMQEYMELSEDLDTVINSIECK